METILDEINQLIYTKSSELTKEDIVKYEVLKNKLNELEKIVENNVDKHNFLKEAKKILSEDKYEELKSLNFGFTFECSRANYHMTTEKVVKIGNYKLSYFYDGDNEGCGSSSWYINDFPILEDGESIEDQDDSEIEKFKILCGEFMKKNGFHNLLALDFFDIFDAF